VGKRAFPPFDARSALCRAAVWGTQKPAIWRAGELVRVSGIAGLVLRDPAGDPLLTRTGRGNCFSLPDYRLTHMIFRTAAVSAPGLAGRS
jgi:hypothetical protein